MDIDFNDFGSTGSWQTACTGIVQGLDCEQVTTSGV